MNRKLKNITIAPHLPDDVIFSNILTRLPLKSLCRFKCVSKLWNATISDDPDFVQLQLSFTQQNLSSSSILGLYHFKTRDKKKICVYNFVKKDDPDFFHFQNDVTTQLVGHLNGLFCFQSQQHIILVNPCTGEILDHPLPPPPPPLNRPIIYGFGIDPLTKQYKAVQIVHANRSFYRCMAYTFGAENNSCRDINSDHVTLHKLPESSRDMINSGRGLYVNGAIFWYFQRIRLVMVFNIHLEEFRFFQGPKPESVFCHCILLEWQGSICLAFQNILAKVVRLYKYRLALPDARIWLLKEAHLHSNFFVSSVRALGGESLLYFLDQNHLISYTEGLDGRFHNLVGSKLTAKFPLLLHEHRNSVMDYQFTHHIENHISLKTLLQSSPTRVLCAKEVSPVPPR